MSGYISNLRAKNEEPKSPKSGELPHSPSSTQGLLLPSPDAVRLLRRQGTPKTPPNLPKRSVHARRFQFATKLIGLFEGLLVVCYLVDCLLNECVIK